MGGGGGEGGAMKGEGGFFEKVLGKESNSPWSKSLFFFLFFF